MLIISPSMLQIDRWLKHSARSAAIALCALAAALLLFFFAYPWNAKEHVLHEGGPMQKGTRFFFPYEAIGSGALALHSRHAFGWVSRLADEIVLIAYNSRPDIDPQEAQILISLKNGKQQVTLSTGKVLYLKESEQGKGLLASETVTGLWIKPLLLDNGAVLVEAGRKLISKEGSSSEEMGQFIISQQAGGPMRYSPSLHSFAKEIKSARSFSCDLLVQKYGGREYGSWKDKAVLEITRGANTYACFVGAGDYLIYDDAEWQPAVLDDLKEIRPLARVKAISNGTLALDVWDEAGFCPLQVNIEIEKPVRLNLNPEVMPSGIRLRSANQVSCALGKRRVILKQGDWLLKTASGWRNLRKSDEIQQYLSHRLKGALFIFDAIEKEQGRSVMKGHIFDETRTQVQPVTLPIDAEKLKSKTSRKRKPMPHQPETERRVA